MVRAVTALRRLLLLLVAAGLAGAWLRRRLEPPSPELPVSGPGPLEIEALSPARAEMGPVTDEMNAIPLPLEEELAQVDAAEPRATAADDEEEAGEELARVEEADPESVDIVSVVDDLLEPPR
jgi:hypothetical protein